jgi:hypothetical protein
MGMRSTGQGGERSRGNPVPTEFQREGMNNLLIFGKYLTRAARGRLPLRFSGAGTRPEIKKPYLF